MSGGSVIPPAKVVINSPQGMRTPPTQVVEGLRDEVAGSGRTLTQPSRETKPSNQTVEDASEEPAVKKVLGGVVRMATDQVQKLIRSQTFLKGVSSLPHYAPMKAFARGLTTLSQYLIVILTW